MRRPSSVLFALAFAVAACQIPGSGKSSSVNAGGGGGGNTTACEEQNDCDSCAACALNGACSSALAACQQSPSCAGIDQCVALCGPGDACLQQCYASNPDAVQLYEALSRCTYCDTCPVDCSGHRTC